MRAWGIVKAFPKLVIVAGLLGASTLLFTWWWMFGTPQHRGAAKERAEKTKQENAEKAALAADRMDRLFLAGGDLYDVDTGEVVFKNWLSESPSKLYYNADSKTVSAVFLRGIVRYHLDGSRDNEFLYPHPVQFTHDYRRVLFPREQDMWEADLDLETLKISNERRITMAGILNERHMIENMLMLTEKAVVLRNFNQQLWIDRETGEVKPIRLMLNEMDKRRSPGGRYLISTLGRTLQLFDADTGETVEKAFRDVSDFQWLDDKSCLALVMGRQLIKIDRQTGDLEEFATLPLNCHKLGMLSPDQKHLFCAGNRGAVLLNLKTKNSKPLPDGSDGYVWLDEERIMFSNHTMDTSLRGTWIKRDGASAQRITVEPFLVDRQRGPLVLVMKEAGCVVFVTAKGIRRIKLDGSGYVELIKMNHLPPTLRAIQGKFK